MLRSRPKPTFDEQKWREAITHPDWYMRLYKDLRKLAKRWRKNPNSPESKRLKEDVRIFFETALKENAIVLASKGINLDKERQPIDTIVIHHTSADPGYRLSYMNALQMLNIYVPYFLNPTVKGEEKLKGQALWSNHFRDKQQVFYAYHWFIRMDGSAKRLLDDDQIGWHAGNWDINCRSVGICLDNDYEDKDPDPEILEKLANHIVKHYPAIKPERVIGHREAREGTTCPGNGFLDGWKDQLVELVRQKR